MIISNTTRSEMFSMDSLSRSWWNEFRSKKNRSMPLGMLSVGGFIGGSGSFTSGQFWDFTQSGAGSSSNSGAFNSFPGTFDTSTVRLNQEEIGPRVFPSTTSHLPEFMVLWGVGAVDLRREVLVQWSGFFLDIEGAARARISDRVRKSMMGFIDPIEGLLDS